MSELAAKRISLRLYKIKKAISIKTLAGVFSATLCESKLDEIAIRAVLQELLLWL
jgi:hypothetical protein